jgi:hypothetical protein
MNEELGKILTKYKWLEWHFLEFRPASDLTILICHQMFQES